MDANGQHQLNQAVYRRLRESINRTYPPNRFLAISGGKIVADADRFESLRSILDSQGEESTNVLIVQAGIDYPETVDILFQV